jgi:hypothetical protein
MSARPRRDDASCIARPHVLPSTLSTASASAAFPISWLTPDTPHNCCVRLVAPSPDAHATLTTWRARPLPRPSWDTSGFANPNRCSRGALEGIETNSCITVVCPWRRAPSSGPFTLLPVVPAKAGTQGFQSLAPGSPLSRGRRIWLSAGFADSLLRPGDKRGGSGIVSQPLEELALAKAWDAQR